MKFIYRLALAACVVGLLRAPAIASAPHFTAPHSSPPPAVKPQKANAGFAFTAALPLEVLGQNSAMTRVIFRLSRPAVSLRLRVHGLEQDNQGSISINNGPWLPLDNTHTTVSEPAASFGGIGGGWATVALSLAVSVPAGTARVSFRFDRCGGANNGFRVLALQFVDSVRHDILPPSAFRTTDPAQEIIPLPSADDIAAGANNWHSAPVVEFPGGATIRAVCADCHSEDGRDLKVFGYSNNAIVQRAEYHGLTAEQATQIASYIRTLPVQATGRPWNPPYQPGPGLDTAPSWAAGAGIDAVLAKDADMLPFLFPGGITKDAARTEGTLNLRELPTALPLPDWNHWLPKIHPKDAWGTDWDSSDVQQNYENLRGLLSVPVPEFENWFIAAEHSGLSDWLLGWDAREDNFIRARQTPGGLAPDTAAALDGTAHLHLVKTWELMQEFDLEGQAAVIWPSGGEAHSWLSRAAFQMSPALIGLPKVQEDARVYEYKNNAWYYLQAVLDAGNRHRQGWWPVDWGYARGRVSDLARATHVPELLRMTALSIKGMQQSDTNGTVGMSAGWYPVWATDLREYTYHDYGFGNGIILDEMLDPDPATNTQRHAQLVTAITGAYLDKMVQFTPQQYYDAGMASATDTRSGDFNRLYNVIYDLLSPWASGYTSLAQERVDPALIDEITAGAYALWPQTDWQAVASGPKL